MTVPESLTDPELRPVWEMVRRRLERSGVGNRGRVRLPDLSARCRHVLSALTGRRLSSTLDLGLLEAGLVRLGVGADLEEALGHLGEPVSREPARRRAARAEAEAARRHARRLVEQW
ncbi:MAG TPA: TIGR02679 domain-containing protein, partial [Longimicrobiales bacterium]|nr:TIGR02679 domain-containing protein [Longimicrobiales bacterium]